MATQYVQRDDQGNTIRHLIPTDMLTVLCDGANIQHMQDGTYLISFWQTEVPLDGATDNVERKCLARLSVSEDLVVQLYVIIAANFKQQKPPRDIGDVIRQIGGMVS